MICRKKALSLYEPKFTICLFIFVSCHVRVCSTHFTLTILSYPYQRLQSSQFSQSKWFNIVKNCSKWSKSVQSSSNYSKSFQKISIGPKCFNIAQIGLKWFKRVQYVTIWSKKVKTDQIYS